MELKSLLLMGASVIAAAQPSSPWVRPQSYTLAGLPSYGVSNRLVYVTDCESTSACSVGGGSTRWLFADTGSAWVAATPVGGGGSSPGGSGTEIQYRGGASTFSALSGSSVPNAGELRIGSGVTPAADATRAIFNVGAAIASGSANGNILGINAPNLYTGNIIQAEVNGSTIFSVDYSGAITGAAGAFNGWAFSTTGISKSVNGAITFGNSLTGLNAATEIYGSNSTGSASRYLALRGGSGGNVIRINTNSQAAMIGQTVNTSSLSDMSLYVSDRTATTGNTRLAIEGGAGQAADLFAAYAYNATPLAGAKVFAITGTGALTLATGVRQTFAPNATNSGLNVGSLSGDPSSPSDGDIWYDSTAAELTARINGANVALGAGGGGGLSRPQAVGIAMLRF